jgi:hypothetical protein
MKHELIDGQKTLGGMDAVSLSML